MVRLPGARTGVTASLGRLEKLVIDPDAPNVYNVNHGGNASGGDPEADIAQAQGAQGAQQGRLVRALPRPPSRRPLRSEEREEVHQGVRLDVRQVKTSELRGGVGEGQLEGAT
eukprot:6691489-Prymnesium_polylepis.1